MYTGAVMRLLGPVLEVIIGSVFPSADEYAKDIWHIVAAEKLPPSVYAFNPFGEALQRPTTLTDETVIELAAKMNEIIASVKE